MEAPSVPGVTIIKDEKGQYMVFVAMDALGYATAVQTIGPRFQQLIANGGPITIFVDHALSRFIFAPAHMRATLALGVSSEHLYDIPGLPTPPPEQQQQQPPVSGPAPPLYPVSEEPNADVFDAPQDDGEATAPVNAVEKRVKRPRNSWIIYRSEKSKQLHQSSANMSAGMISTEVARMWAAEPAEIREYYQSLANAEAQDHREKYPDWRYQPAKPNGPA